jgi:fermentation-respiration switch protein FrsA (DUF1100 family)
VAAAAFTVAGLWGTMMLFEDSLLFFPTSWPRGFPDAAAFARRAGVPVEECWIPVEEGLRLHAWWCRPPGAGAVLLLFHGNAGSLAERSDLMLALASAPAEVVVVDYQGYGRSQGRPSEEGLYADASAAWRYLTEARGVPAARIVLLGKSLGGAVAVDLATRVRPAGLVVQSSFTSVPAMAAVHYPFVPGVLIRNRFDSAAKIGRVRCPVLVVHSTADEIVPYGMGRRLFELAREPKRFFEVEGAAHNETWVAAGEPWRREIARFAQECVSRAAAP